MKRLFFLLIILFMCFQLFGEPVFSPEKQLHDFGEIYEKDGKAVYLFRFTNTGDEPLKVLDVHAS